MKKYNYLVSRRITQAAGLFLFFTGNAFGWSILRGNLSSAKIFDAVPLSDPFAILQSFSAGASIAVDALAGALIIFLFYAVIGGRVFCSWICPVNMVTDLATWIRKTLRLDSTLKYWDIRRGVRYWVIALSITLSAILGVAAFEWISPIGAMHRGIIYGFGFGWMFVLVVFLFDLIAVKNGFCGHVCPLGGFYSLIGRFGILRIGYDMEKCTSCHKCFEICPESQVLDIVDRRSGAVLSGECINCGRCIEVCDDNALNFNCIYSKRFNESKKEG
jgi:ferredoxin-type protein NapH